VLKSLIALALGLATLLGFGIAVYQIEFVTPAISVAIVPIQLSYKKPGKWFGFRIDNQSYVDFLDVVTVCKFNKVLADDGFIVQKTTVEGFLHQTTSTIGAGTAKISLCQAVVGPFSPIREGDVEFLMGFKVRCMPLLARCSRFVHKRFRFDVSAGTWIEGETF
jgi:hypothetical protein